jgi:hypothetical protein
MLGPQNLLRVFNEMVFVLLGGLLIWLAVTGRYLFNPRSMTWLLLSGLAVAFGLVPLFGRSAADGSRTAAFVRGGSLIIVGIVMFSMAWAPLGLIVWLLMVAGIVLALRGIVGAFMSLRVSPNYRAPVR